MNKNETVEKRKQTVKNEIRTEMNLLLTQKELLDEVVLENLLWDTILIFQGTPFYTAKNLEFSYKIKGNEMFVDRKDKSITRATVALALHTALELQKNEEKVTGPKKLKTFGASYLYPLFIEFGIIL